MSIMKPHARRGERDVVHRTVRAGGSANTTSKDMYAVRGTGELFLMSGMQSGQSG